MAQLNTRGTMTRNRWDFHEHSNGVANVVGTVASGQIGAYFANNSTGATAVDIYTVSWSSSVNGLWSLALLPPPLILTPLAPSTTSVSALQPDQAQPPGLVGMYTFNAGAYTILVHYSQQNTGALLAPIMGSYFITLPPGWGITVGGTISPGPCELSFTIWFQYVLDNISPAV